MNDIGLLMNSTASSGVVALPPVIKGVNVLWMNLGGFLVFFMQAGFAFLEAGAIRSKHVKNILLKNLIDVCIGSMCYFAVGYAFAFGPLAKNGFVGVGNFFLIPSTTPLEPDRLDLYSHFFFQWSFSSAAATIISGAMAERTHFTGYRILSASTSAFIYPVVTHWVWADGGWLRSLGFVDFAGGACVHMVGGLLAGIGAWALGPRIGRFEPRPVAGPTQSRPQPHSRQPAPGPTTSASPTTAAAAAGGRSKGKGRRGGNTRTRRRGVAQGSVPGPPQPPSTPSSTSTSIIGSALGTPDRLAPLSSPPQAADSIIGSGVDGSHGSGGSGSGGGSLSPLSSSSSSSSTVDWRLQTLVGGDQLMPLGQSPRSRRDTSFGHGQTTVGPVVANVIPPHAPVLSFLGCFILWFGWYGFNCASVSDVVLYPDAVGQVAVVTTMSGAAAALVSLTFGKYSTKKHSLAYGMNGLLAGLVASTSVARLIDPWVSLFVGAVAGLVYVGSSKLLIRLRVDDALDACPVHFFSGLWSVVAAGLFAKQDAVAAVLGHPAVHHWGLFYGGGAQLLGVQLLGILSIVAWVSVIGVPLVLLVRHFGCLRLPHDHEMLGLDVSVHDGPAYPEFLLKME